MAVALHPHENIGCNYSSVAWLNGTLGKSSFESGHKNKSTIPYLSPYLIWKMLIKAVPWNHCKHIHLKPLAFDRLSCIDNGKMNGRYRNGNLIIAFHYFNQHPHWQAILACKELWILSDKQCGYLWWKIKSSTDVVIAGWYALCCECF